MPAAEISKRFTLHDLFGYMLPGCVFLLFTTVVCSALVGNSETGPYQFLADQFKSLDLTGRVIAFVVSAYVIGLGSMGIGDALKWMASRALLDTRIWNKPNERLEAPDLVMERFLEKVAGLSGLTVDTLKSEDESQADDIRNHKPSKTIAYAHLIQMGRDGFAQLMSGRGAMFQGLAGAFFLVPLATGAVLLLSSDLSVSGLRLVIGSFLALAGLIGLEVWCLLKAHEYDCWFDHHVAYGFLALPESAKERFKDNEEALSHGG